MIIQLSLLSDIIRAEFDGESWNGPNFITTLRSLTPEAAASTDSVEGYSAWGVALHVMRYKLLLGRALGGTGEVQEPVDLEKDYPPLPEDRSLDSWNTTLHGLEQAHRLLLDALENGTSSRLEEIFESRNVPFRAALTWIATHDVFHAAQIRSMGTHKQG